MGKSQLYVSRKLLFIAVLLGFGGAAVLAASVSAANSTGCLNDSDSNPSISVSGTTATAHFTLPKNCTNQVVTLVSYKAPNGIDGKPYDQQQLFKATTRTFNISGRREMSVQIPDCFFQIDLVKGQPITSFAGGTTYHAQHRFLVARQGGNKPCNQPAAAPQPTPAAPTVNNINTSLNNVSVAAVQNVDASSKDKETTKSSTAIASTTDSSAVAVAEEVPATVETPSSGQLPDTGPGTIAAFSFGSTFMGSIIYAYRSRFSDLIAQLINRFHL